MRAYEELAMFVKLSCRKQELLVSMQALAGPAAQSCNSWCAVESYTGCGEASSVRVCKPY